MTMNFITVEPPPMATSLQWLPFLSWQTAHALTLILTSRQWQQSLKYIATRLLARWAARHPVDRHLLKKIVLFFICPLINCVIPENIHTFPTEGIFL